MAETIRVTLIESHAALRSDLARALTGSGFRVTARADAQRSADRDRRDPPPDVQVLDVSAPGVLDLLAPPADLSRTVLLVSESTVAAGGLPVRSGECEILAKPFDYRVLEARILKAAGVPRTGVERLRDPMLLTADPGLASRFDRARRLARKSVSICLEGELGTGRRALAEAIHDWSDRASCDFEVLERSALEGPGAEASLLAAVSRVGEGTVVVADPGELPEASQHALMSVLRRMDREQGPRWLCLSTLSLEQAVAEGRLAPELHYRLEDARISLPALRERPRDQLAICRAIVRRVARELGERAPEIDEQLVASLGRDGFRGNRLGLESRLRNALIRSASGEGELASILAGEVGQPAQSAAGQTLPSVHLKTLERDAIVRALGHRDGNRTRASEDLGINVRTLRNKIREYGLR